MKYQTAVLVFLALGSLLAAQQSQSRQVEWTSYGADSANTRAGRQFVVASTGAGADASLVALALEAK